MFGIYFNKIGHGDHQAIKPYLMHPNDELVLCHCVVEANNDSISCDISRSLKATRRKAFVPFISTSAHDCAAVIYVIDKLQESMSIEIDFSNCSVQEEQIARLADALSKNGANVKVMKLDLKGNKLRNLSMLNLFQRASCAFSMLKRLCLNNNRIGIGGTKFFPVQPPFNELSLLDLSHNPLEVSGMKVLESVINSDCLTELKKLLLQNVLTTDAKINATVIDTFMKAISNHCHCLKTQDLSQNNLGVPGASILGRVLSEHMKLNSEQQGWLSELKLNRTNLRDEGLCTLVENIEGSYCFNKIYLRGNDIHAPGVVCLVNAICSGRITMEENLDHRVELWLDDNPIGLEGTPAIGRLLSNDRSQIGAIGLNSLYDKKTVGQTLYELPQNDTIQSLYLDDNNFTADGIHILAGLIYLCPYLQNLFTRRCTMVSDDFKWIVNELAQVKLSYPNICSELHAWDLGDNNIDNDGLSTLMELQLSTMFPEISGANKRRNRYAAAWNIMLHNNPVSKEMIGMLNKEWKRQDRVSVVL